MELVQRIKEAEQQARELIEKAKQESAGLLEKTAAEEEQIWRQAQQERKDRIAAAVTEAEQIAQVEMESLLNEGQKQINTLQQKAADRMEECVSSVLAHLPQ